MNAAALLSIAPRSTRFSYDERDAILNALGIGMGADPLDASQLPFVNERGLRTVPTMSAMFVWELDELLAEAGIAFDEYLYAKQRLVMHLPLPASEMVHSRRSSARYAMQIGICAIRPWS